MVPKIIKTRQDFDAELKAPGRSVALFHSAWCPFCAAFAPEFDAQAKAGAEVFLKISTDDLPGLEDVFSVEVVPTVLSFEDGRLSSRLDGVLGRGLSAENLRAFLGAARATQKP